MRSRPAARLLLLDADDRVLLLCSRGDAEGAYWYTPGGAVEAGESYEAAAMRELGEELGVSVASVGAPVGERTFELELTSGEHVVAEERFFAVRLTADVSLEACSDAERAFVSGHRWWSVAELGATSERIFPDRIPDMLAKANSHLSKGSTA